MVGNSWNSMVVTLPGSSPGERGESRATDVQSNQLADMVAEVTKVNTVEPFWVAEVHAEPNYFRSQLLCASDLVFRAWVSCPRQARNRPINMLGKVTGVRSSEHNNDQRLEEANQGNDDLPCPAGIEEDRRVVVCLSLPKSESVANGNRSIWIAWYGIVSAP